MFSWEYNKNCCLCYLRMSLLYLADFYMWQTESQTRQIKHCTVVSPTRFKEKRLWLETTPLNSTGGSKSKEKTEFPYVDRSFMPADTGREATFTLAGGFEPGILLLWGTTVPPWELTGCRFFHSLSGDSTFLWPAGASTKKTQQRTAGKLSWIRLLEKKRKHTPGPPCGDSLEAWPCLVSKIRHIQGNMAVNHLRRWVPALALHWSSGNKACWGCSAAAGPRK